MHEQQLQQAQQQQATQDSTIKIIIPTNTPIPVPAITPIFGMQVGSIVHELSQMNHGSTHLGLQFNIGIFGVFYLFFIS